AAGLIRSRVRPSRMDLRTALGLQLVSMCVLAGAAAAVVAPFGRIAAITDLMLVSIPLTVWQTPARVVLERELAYRRVAVVEMAQSFVFSGWCVAAVLALPALGFCNVASRVLRAPLTLYGAVWRVSYPAMSRVVEHDRAPRRVLERAMTAAAVGCGLILAPLGGSALAAVPVIFGSQ